MSVATVLLALLCVACWPVVVLVTLPALDRCGLADGCDLLTPPEGSWPRMLPLLMASEPGFATSCLLRARDAGRLRLVETGRELRAVLMVDDGVAMRDAGRVDKAGLTGKRLGDWLCVWDEGTDCFDLASAADDVGGFRGSRPWCKEDMAAEGGKADVERDGRRGE